MPSEKFGTLLKKLREQAGLSQSALAAGAGLHPSHLNRIELGERKPPKRGNLLALVKVLGLDANQADLLLLRARYAPLSEKERARLGLIIPISPVPEELSFLRASPFPPDLGGKARHEELIQELKTSKLLQAAHQIFENEDLSPPARKKIDEMGAQFVRWLLENWKTLAEEKG